MASLSTAVKMVGPKRLTYFSAWFCPFAHRCTIALEHHGRDIVDWEWCEALGWEERPPTGRETFEASEREDWVYHWKSPELLQANPLGMIPTLQEIGGERRVVRESIVCCEFVDEIARQMGSTASPLLPPDDPFECARLRVSAERVNRTVTSSYYAALVRTDPMERQEAFDRILGGLEEFVTESKGDFFSGSQGLSLVDCVLFPYAWRLFALEHYRGFSIPKRGGNGDWMGRYHAWLERCESLSYVARTLPGKDRYIQHVEKYATGRARSKVGNAVRRGKAAHDYDDDIDG